MSTIIALSLSSLGIGLCAGWMLGELAGIKRERARVWAHLWRADRAQPETVARMATVVENEDETP